MNATATEQTHGKAHEHGEAHEHGMSNAGYVKIAILLAVLTAIEVATYYVDFGALFLPTLLVLMSVKFFIVVSYFMHLKFDNKIFGLTPSNKKPPASYLVPRQGGFLFGRQRCPQRRLLIWEEGLLQTMKTPKAFFLPSAPPRG